MTETMQAYENERIATPPTAAARDTPTRQGAAP